MPRKKKGPTVVERLVRQLRELALGTPPGELIGSEDLLISTYQVCRPTLRQAAALVAQEQLLSVKRGLGGGYFARRPETDAVANVAAIYLQSRHVTSPEIIRAIEPLRVDMAVLAARNRDPTQVAELKAFLERDTETARTGGYREFLRSEMEFSHLVGKACQNTVLEVFFITLQRFSGFLTGKNDIFRNRPERVMLFWELRLKCLVSIVEGDAELAGIAAQRCARLGSEWMLAACEGDDQDDVAPLFDIVR